MFKIIYPKTKIILQNDKTPKNKMFGMQITKLCVSKCKHTDYYFTEFYNLEPKTSENSK